jgi:hypothetical protein
VHGNRHVTTEQLKKTRASLLLRAVKAKPDAPLKAHKSVVIWKITLFDTQACTKFMGLLTKADLEEHFESDEFRFFAENRHVPVPNLMELLREYMLLLFTHRTVVGLALAWNLPRFKKPLDENGK